MCCEKNCAGVRRMVEDAYDSGNTSFLSQSYAQGIERISGKLDVTQDEFALADEIVEARKRSWARLFEKLEKANDSTELNYLTLRPVDESNESQIWPRFPVRKSTSQIQHWIDTGEAPCQAIELSDAESVSISESETEEPEEFQSSASRSMLPATKMTDRSRAQLGSGPSSSSVDTAAYIESSGNSARRKKRPHATDPGMLDNSKVARCVNAAWPKVLITRLPDSVCKSKEIAQVPQALQGNGSEEDAKELSKRRRLYTEDKYLFDIASPQSSTVRRSSFGRKSMHPAMDSPSTFPQRKANRFGPRLLATSWRTSRIRSITRRLSRNRLSLFKPQTPKTSRGSLRNSGNVLKDSAEKIDTAILSQKAEDSQNLTQSSPKAEERPSPTSQLPASSSDSVKKIETTILSQKVEDSQNLTQSSPKEEEKPPLTSQLPASSSDSVKKIETAILSQKAEDSQDLTKLSPKGEEKPPSASQSSASSSVGSGDVSQIIKEDLNTKELGADAVSPECKDFREDQGSIFKAVVDFCAETEKSRKPNIVDAKKNLYKTILKFSSDPNSPTSASSSSLKNDGIESLKHLVQLNPKVLVHDFLKLGECCGQLEKENNTNWLRRKKEAGILGAERGEIEPTVPEIKDSQENKENYLSETEIKQKAPVRKKKRRSERKLKYPQQSKRNTYITRFDFATDSSNASEKREACLTIVERNGTSADSKENVTVTFTNTEHDQRGLIFVQSSSEDEDIIRTLTSILKQKPAAKKRGTENKEETEASKSTKTFRKTLTIVSSSSEEEETTVEKTSKIQKPTRRAVTRNKRGDSKKTADRSETSETHVEKSESQFTRNRLATTSTSSEDVKKTETVSESQRVTRKYSEGKKRRDSKQSTDKSESSKGRDEELKHQLPSVKTSSEKNEDERDLSSATNKLNSKHVRSQRSRDSNKSEILISGDKDDADKAGELKMNEKEKDRTDILENETNPVDRELSREDPVEDALKKSSHVKKADNSTEGRIDSRVEDKQDFELMGESIKSDIKGERKNSVETGEGGRKAAYKRLSRLVCDLSDESSDNDDTMIFTQKNYTGSNSLQTKSTRSKDSTSTTKSKNRSRKSRVTSTIVYRTKEFSGTDSDHF